MASKLTHEQFLEKVRPIHGHKYVYLEEYQSALIPMKIFCPIHQHIFLKSPNKHISRGQGCPLCGREGTANKLRLSLDDFISKAKIVHPNDDFDYSLVQYKISGYPVEIIHFACGRSFWQSPNAHLTGHGCTYCNTRWTIELPEFLERCQKIHGIKYDYSLIDNYDNLDSIISIKCNTCGHIFSQKASNHVHAANGCPQCIGRYVLGTASFVEKAHKMHGDNYDYSQVEYINSMTKVSIRCRVCDRYFDQLPYLHIAGSGCPICPCRKSKSEELWLDSLDVPQEYRSVPIKIGTKLFKTDAYDHATCTIYEFYGDYWHGNPKKYAPEKINGHNEKTMGELYQATLAREELIKQAGYKIISIWESDWKKIAKQMDKNE